MRRGMYVDWRQVVMRTMLVWIVLTQTGSEATAGVWQETKKQAQGSYELIQVKRKKPKRFKNIQTAWSLWQESRSMLMRLLCRLLAYYLGVWLSLLWWLIEKNVNQLERPVQGCLVWRRPCRGATLEVELEISMMPADRKEVVGIELVDVVEWKPSAVCDDVPIQMRASEKHIVVESELHETKSNVRGVDQIVEQKTNVYKPI